MRRLRELNLGWRALRKSPAFAVVGVLTLALGIGGTTAFFSVLDAALIRPLPFPEADRLVRLRATFVAAGGGTYLANLGPRDAAFLKERSRSFDVVTAQRVENFTLLGAGDPVRLPGASVSSGSLALLGVSPILGRRFTPLEERNGEASGVVLISDRLWRDRFAADTAVVGKSLRLADRVVTIVGVLAPDFHFPYRADIWQPLTIEPSDTRQLLVLARLRRESTLSSARREMVSLMGDLRALGGGPMTPLPVDVTMLRDNLVRNQQGTALLLFGAALLFLLIASVNLTSLLLARVVTRQRDFAIRSALGANRGNLIAVAVGEPFIVTVLGAAVALVSLHWTGPLLSALVPQVLSQELGLEPVSINPRIVGFAAATAILTALVASLAPAVRASHSDAVLMLRSAGAMNRSSGSQALRALLVGEIATLCVLLLSAGALIEGFVHVSRTPLGLQPVGLLAIEIDPPRSRYDDSLKLRQLVANIRREVASLPATRVGVTTINPLRGATWGTEVRPVGASPQEAVTVNLRMVSPRLFDAMGIALLGGRDFGQADVGGPPVAIVSRGLARHFWRRDDVVGERLQRTDTDGASVITTVVGVAGDVEDAGDMHETIYLPFDQVAGLAENENSFWVMARGDAASAGWIHDVERAVWRVDADLAWSDLGMMDAMRLDATVRERLGTRLAAAFGAFAVLLAGLGLAGVMGFLVSQREAEIGVRLALGADAPMIAHLLAGQGMWLAFLGAGIGLVAFFLMWPVTGHFVGGLRAPGVITLVVAVGLILIVSASAAYLPARRAARLDPLVVLRG